MNKWKIAFIVLLSLNVLFVAVITGLVFSSKGNKQESSYEAEKVESVPLLVQTDKKSLTALVNDYLKKESMSKTLQYHVELKDKLYLTGTMKAFSKDIEMEIVFQPEVINEQTMRLHVNEFTIGKLQLPIGYVLKYMEGEYNFPKAVNINSKEKYMDVHLNELTFNSNMTANVESFDLKKDKIAFRLFMPINE